MTVPLVAVVAIDGYALDLLPRHDPVATAQVRVITTTAPAPADYEVFLDRERAARDVDYRKLA